MTKDEAVNTLTVAFTQRVPGLDFSVARVLADEAVCAMGGDLKLDPQIVTLSANMVRAKTNSMM